MAYNLRMVTLLALSIAAVMVLSASAAATTSASVSTAGTLAAATVAPVGGVSTTGAAHVDSGSATTEARILSSLKSDNAPMRDVFLPNFGAQVSTLGGVVTPTYNVSPAPMGLGDIGVQDVSGHDVGTVSYTSSVEGSASLSAIDPLYVTSSAPDVVTIQLNTVLTNVDLFGNTSYDFWIQNVPVYSAGSGTLSFEDNIWNFSSPTFFFSSNAIYSHGPYGQVIGNELYASGGPSYHVPTPFTVVTYNNATVLNDRPTIFFNYTVVTTTGRISGSYDQVEFNSSATTPTSASPPPTFQINGQAVNPTGFLLNDAEIMLGGPGGGSTTTLFNIAGSMGLWLLPNGTATYVTVPSALDFGSDTGETSEGIGEASTTGPNPVAILSSGPSLLYPLWGMVGAHPGAEKITVYLFPTNAFVFVSTGATFNENFAEWAPTPVSGPAVYWLSPGTYTFQFLLSEYKPVTKTLALHASHDLAITLSHDAALGVYTPLWAEANSQLRAIS